MDESYAERDLNVGFSGGEKKKAEILQMLMLEPKLAILDETDSGLDVDAVRTVSEGVRLFRERTHGSLLIITHSTRILEALQRGRGARHGKGRNRQERRRVSGGRDQRKGLWPACRTTDARIQVMKEKSYVEDIDRSVYDIRDEERDAYRMQAGLTPEIVQKLSEEKNDPAWMQQFRLQALQIYNEMRDARTGARRIEGLDIDHIATYVRPNTKMQNDWKNVPQDIKDTFERLGIPQAERKSLAGVGAQYDSELVYHNVRDEVAAAGRGLHRHGERADAANTPTWCASTS